MAEPLPNEFDVVVIGTGLPESIVAAACSRIGLAILHIDRNEFYGGPWSSFNLEAWTKWADEMSGVNRSTNIDDITDDVNSLSELRETAQLAEGERIFVTKSRNNDNPFFNVSTEWLVPERFEKPESSPMDPENLQTADLPNDPSVDNPLKAAEVTNQTETMNESTLHNNKDPADRELLAKNLEEHVKVEEKALDEGAQNKIAKENINVEEEKTQNIAEATTEKDEAGDFKGNKIKEKEWSKNLVEVDWRRFWIDVTPKLLCGRGKMVQLLISSGVSRYAEFKSVDRILTWIDGQFKQVPCSRSDVFQTKDVSMIEKRRLMKLLTFCLNYETETKEYEGFKERSFEEFLASRDLSSEVCHYVRCAIGMVPKSAKTIEGLKAVHKFLMSVGKFGSSPFLWTLYGSGELPQCFCRLCAVFGGIYCLRRPIEAWVVNQENNVVGIVSEGQRINCRYVISDPTYVPRELINGSDQTGDVIHRAVLVTTDSLLKDAKQHVSLFNVDADKCLVRLLELGSGSMVCPNRLYLVHLTAMTQEDSTAVFDDVINQYFESNTGQAHEEENAKPRILWKSCFNYHQRSVETEKMLASNVGVTVWPDPVYDYEKAVDNAKEIFQRFWPDDDFLPEIPQDDESAFPEATDPAVNGFIPPLEAPQHNDDVRDAQPPTTENSENVTEQEPQEGSSKTGDDHEENHEENKNNGQAEKKMSSHSVL